MTAVFTFQGEKQTVVSSRLALTLETESWDSDSESWVYGKELGVLASLEVVVDEESGQDGAAAPDAYWRLDPLPEDLFHSTWDESAPDFEAWFGNDAPELEQNHIALLGRNDHGQVKICWTAQCEGNALRFEGWVDFDGLTVRVADPEDAPRFLKQLWPGLNWDNLKPEEGETVEFDANFALERRRWYPFTYRW